MAYELHTYSNKKAIQIIVQEGIGYAVQSYCSAEEFKDPQTVLLWQKARDALDSLEFYLVHVSSIEDDEDEEHVQSK